MTVQVNVNGVMRDATPAEIAEIEARKAAAQVPVVPASIPMLNAHLVLIEAGWLPLIEAHIENMPPAERATTNAYLNLAPLMHRNHPLVLSIPAALSKTEAEVDALFIAAGKLDV